MGLTTITILCNIVGEIMDRLSLLKSELSKIKEFKCIPFDLKYKLISRYEIEIKAIEVYKLQNTEMKEDIYDASSKE